MPLNSTRGAGSAKGFGLTAGGAVIDNISFLVLGGGGGGGLIQGGGGGAGGYRLSNPDDAPEQSGGNSSQEGQLKLAVGLPYSLIIGAGGSAGTGPSQGSISAAPGSPSVFATITSTAGGGGGSIPSGDVPLYWASPLTQYNPIDPSGNLADGISGRGLPGGAAGGNGVGSNTNGQPDGAPSPTRSADPAKRGPGTTGQGFPGGLGAYTDQNPFPGGGGGGVGSAGNNATPGPPAGGSPQPGSGGPGGDGLTSNINATPTTRGGGGGGGSREDQGPGGSGGPGGGGSWRNDAPGTAGGTNQGAGGGAAAASNQSQNPGGNGGSGLVVVRIPTGFTASFSPGVTQTPSSTPTRNIYTVTATSDSAQTITFNKV